MTVSIVVADDNRPLRTSVRWLLEREPDFQVVGEAADGAEAVALAERLQPTLVILDIAMPKKNGLEAAAEIRQCAPKSRLVILSSYDDEAHVTAAFRVGVTGYVCKGHGLVDLIPRRASSLAGTRLLEPAPGAACSGCCARAG